MILSIALLLTVLLTILAFRTKSLHKIEVIVLIVFISNIVNNVYSMWGLNLNHIKTSDRMEEFISFVLVSAAMMPALITCMLGIILSIRTLVWKYLFIIISPFLLILIEYLADVVGLIEHYQMSIWDSLIVWTSVLLIAYIFRSFFYSLLKGV
ncbi:hypothetical protein [Ornithinibacillus bavariensis]|uniref:Uncharacterized protein n=1 Tax=Ornithinibacillus bavariensis TaxID=545502 RepID=A0A920C559_9BACI|nr:hypothetical protein [Ornithinibacillus bavariensis]GIO26365.1 hypothetical protein J43TS3_09760 [Ornithinibacillus bavariensis]